MAKLPMDRYTAQLVANGFAFIMSDRELAEGTSRYASVQLAMRLFTAIDEDSPLSRHRIAKILSALAGAQSEQARRAEFLWLLRKYSEPNAFRRGPYAGDPDLDHDVWREWHGWGDFRERATELDPVFGELDLNQVETLLARYRGEHSKAVGIHYVAGALSLAHGAFGDTSTKKTLSLRIREISGRFSEAERELERQASGSTVKVSAARCHESGKSHHVPSKGNDDDTTKPAGRSAKNQTPTR